MTAALYRHSNKAPITGLAAGAAAMFIGGPAIAAVYAVAITYIGVVVLNFLVTALFGALIGFGIAFAMKKGKVRNTRLTVVAAFLGTVFTHYVGWVFWTGLVFWRGDVEVPVLAILLPPSFWQILREIVAVGTWAVGNSDRPVSGGLLAMIWLVEAVTVFGASLAAAVATAESDPFCEQCESWCLPEDAVLRVTGTLDGGALASRLTAGDLAALSEVPAAQPEENPWQQIDLCLCDGCGSTNTLTLSRVTVTYEKGKAREKKEELVNRMLISPEQAAWVQQLGGREAQPIDATAA